MLHFFTLLDNASDQHCFTTRTKGNKELTRVFYGTYETLLPKLTVYNSDLGADIWCTVNRTNGTGRTAKDITHLRAFFADCDKGAPTTWKLQPSIIVESSPGKVQAYWLLDTPIEATEETISLWESVEATVVTTCGADEAAKDVARVLRVPGFANRKYAELPVARVLEISEKRYSLADMVAAFPPTKISARPIMRSVSPEEMQDEARRVTRYRAWLDAIDDVPATGGGQRNRFFFKKSAYGVRDLGLSAETVAEVMSEYATRWHGNDAYDEEKCFEIASNAAQHGRNAVGNNAGVANIVLDMTDGPAAAATAPIPITRNQGGGTVDEAARKIRATAIRAQVELSGSYVVTMDDKGQHGYAQILGPGILTPCSSTTIIGDMVRRYGADHVHSKIKHELLPTWTYMCEKVMLDGIKPFVFASSPPIGWAWQRLSFDPDPNATCPETFAEMLTRTKEREYLVLWLGSILDYTFPRVKYLHIWGEGNDGKSTLIKTIAKAFSQQGVTYMREEDLAGHGTAKLEGARLVCFVDEDNPKFVSSGTFKALLGDDVLTINPKYQPSRNIRLHAKVILASNPSPEIKGGIADERRIMPVHFESFKKDGQAGSDQDFVARMISESSAIMQYCYSQFENWKARFPNCDLPTSEDRMEEIRATSVEADIEELVESRIEFVDGGVMTPSEVRLLFTNNDNTRLPRAIASYLRKHGAVYKVVKKDGKACKRWLGIASKIGASKSGLTVTVV